MTQGVVLYAEGINPGSCLGVCPGPGSGAGVRILSYQVFSLSLVLEVLRLGGIVGKIQYNQPWEVVGRLCL